ncbi:MAG TPA: DNA translocase FtsK 4TM domain-containing protein [Stellaceae bacterium]|nr:DNA translocase FtsK 4TM domain-containing protein [Stellaceae bacterium]
MASITDSGRKYSAREPRSWGRFMVMTCGAICLVIGAFLIAALISHDPTDPSWNQSINGVAKNLMGLPGARIADLLLQWFGLAAWLLPLVLIDWAVRCLGGRGLKRFWLKLLVLPPLLLIAPLAISIVPPSPSWALKVGLGGVIGKLGRDGFAHVSIAPPLSAMAAALVVALILLYLMGFSALSFAPRAAEDKKRYVRPQNRRAVAEDDEDEEDEGSADKPGLIARARGLLPSLSLPSLSSVSLLWKRDEDEDAVLTRERYEPSFAGGGDAGARRDVNDDAEDEVEGRKPLLPRRAAAVDLPKKPKKREAQRQQALDLGPSAGEHLLPGVELLDEVAPSRFAQISEEALQQNARLLESVLADFGIQGQIVKVRPGPVVALYELEPAPGIKASRIIGLADDIARSMSAISARVAVVPGRNVIGIELPSARAETIYLRELLASEDYERHGAKLPLVLGKDIGGAPVLADLARMPHLLIAGTTGSGKSVGINTMILSILYRMLPDQCKFIMIDPKMLELSVYDGIPHLLAPVVTEARKAVVALKWTVREMENRYRAMSKLGVRNIEGYNQRLAEAQARGEILKRKVQTGFDEETGKPIFEEQPLASTPLPMIVVVVDEMADLMLVAGKDIEAAVQRLAQMARAAGIHIIMATQRPSVDVITGTIKANFPTRISFQVTSKIDSRTILGESGAEQLLGRGDMLYMAGGGRIQRVHGPFVADEEVERVVRFLKDNGGPPSYLEEVTEEDEDAPMGFGGDGEGGGSGDDLYDRAVALVCRERKASTSFVQRHLQIGYNRAARIIEKMEAEGVVSSANHVGKREVLGRNIDERE